MTIEAKTERLRKELGEDDSSLYEDYLSKAKSKILNAAFETDSRHRCGLLLHRRMERLSLAVDDTARPKSGAMAALSDTDRCVEYRNDVKTYHERENGCAHSHKRADIRRIRSRSKIHSTGLRISRA